MSMFNKTMPLADANDSNLVMYSLGGNRDAFCEIVTRYQNLLCSLAYSAIGDIRHSEDIAQEAFVDAWRKLDSLHDPEKLKSWLCGILRFKVSRFRRSQINQPVQGAQELDESSLPELDNSALEGAAIQQQEQDLLWKVLQQIDETYREPLVLFYREQQSVERVAAELELSEDAVKQRLSRGRKLLKEAMSDFVEDALKVSKPGVAFTVGVMSIVSTISPPAKAAAIGAGAAKTGSYFSLAGFLTLLAAVSGIISSLFALKASLDQSRTERERSLVTKSVILFLSVAGVFVAGMLLLKPLTYNDPENAAVYTFIAHAFVFVFIACYLMLVCKLFGAMRELRAQERIFHPEAFNREADQKDSKKREYISRYALLGIPLVHIQFGMQEKGDKPALAWIAGGSYAHGLLFAWGGVAIAPVSVGIVSVGILSIGAVGFGLLSIGTAAIGFIAFGASAVGYKAYASLSSLGWESALSGGFSVAKNAAVGAVAYAEQANTELAAQMTQLSFFQQHYHWVLGCIAITVIVPAALYARKVNQRMR